MYTGIYVYDHMDNINFVVFRIIRYKKDILNSTDLLTVSKQFLY